MALSQALKNELDKLEVKDVDDVVDYVKRVIKLAQSRALMEFSKGDEVEWSGKRGKKKGIIKSINQKTASIEVPHLNDKGESIFPNLPEIWRVPPSMLRKVS